jgi:hypothetical protein
LRVKYSESTLGDGRNWKNKTIVMKERLNESLTKRENENFL